MLWLDYMQRSWGIEERVAKWESIRRGADFQVWIDYVEKHESRLSHSESDAVFRYMLFRPDEARGYIKEKYPELPPVPVAAHRPHPNQLVSNPLEGWQ